MRLRPASRIALIAGALALVIAASSAAAQVKINGKEVMLANKSAWGSAIDSLPPPPPKFGAMAPEPKTSGPTQYQNSFECIPGAAPGHAEKITLHGQYDMRSVPSPRNLGAARKR